MCNREKVQVIYFLCPSLLRKEGKIIVGNEAPIVMSSLVKHLANICEQYLSVYLYIQVCLNR